MKFRNSTAAHHCNVIPSILTCFILVMLLTTFLSNVIYLLNLQDTVFCKSILNEFAVKMNLEKPTYTTVQPEGLLPVFVSSLVFNGVTYTGDAGRNKKEAEQLAARTVILSILGNNLYMLEYEIVPDSLQDLCKISPCVRVDSVSKHVCLYVCAHPAPESQGPILYSYWHFACRINFWIPPCKGKEVEVAPGTDQLLPTAVSVPLSGQLVHVPVTHPPVHELEKPKPNVSSEVIAPPISFVPSVFEQPLVVSPTTGRKRNRKNKKKANKKLRTDAQ
ncbi:Double-stranded RNA-binding protein 4 [Vitis vinifera]|uniref:Double-stranded RNA-binding protein 4 n=1 Tax=Vitis vinifera TaxID=29760 RepID=A0A438CNX0_VITVI|nr:Double-stranded RNA-binding protein 4 [Vitis vinifera]